ncbi:hypothetical protein MTO96_049338 [Rhipicephalus appendiculatus]
MKIRSPPNRAPASGLRDKAPVTYSKRLVCLVAFAVVAALVVAVVALYYLSAMIVHRSARKGDRDASGERLSLSCRTDGCSRFEALLADTLNTSVDPCHDFKAYVSSRWLPDPSKELDAHWRYKWNVKYAWMRMMADEIRLRNRESPLGRLMARLLQSMRAQVGCRNLCCFKRKALFASSDVGHQKRSVWAHENSAETRKKFKQLMRELGIPWPEKPPIDVDPFEAHLNLSIRWNVPLWFDVKMLPALRVSGRKVIYIYPSALRQVLEESVPSP